MTTLILIITYQMICCSTRGGAGGGAEACTHASHSRRDSYWSFVGTRPYCYHPAMKKLRKQWPRIRHELSFRWEKTGSRTRAAPSTSSSGGPTCVACRAEMTPTPRGAMSVTPAAYSQGARVQVARVSRGARGIGMGKSSRPLQQDLQPVSTEFMRMRCCW
jgi:hypothetical protein